MPAVASTSRKPRRSPLMRSSKTRPAGPLSSLNRPLRRDLPLVHHDDVVAGVLDVGQQVRRQDQADALVVPEIAHELEHLVAPFRVHAVGRLVEEQEVGIVDERLRELDALLHARSSRSRRCGSAPRRGRRSRGPRARAASRRPPAARRAGRSRRRTRRRSCRECARRSRACSRGARGSRAARCATSSPSTVIRPSVGFTKPSSALSIVLLPAPLGPSRPTAPRAKRRGHVLERPVVRRR